MQCQQAKHGRSHAWQCTGVVGRRPSERPQRRGDLYGASGVMGPRGGGCSLHRDWALLAGRPGHSQAQCLPCSKKRKRKESSALFYGHNGRLLKAAARSLPCGNMKASWVWHLNACCEVLQTNRGCCSFPELSSQCLVSSLSARTACLHALATALF